MPELKAIIIADDLTGALDSSAPFAALGLRCLTALSPDALARAMAHAPEILAITLGTREAPAEIAAARMAEAAALLTGLAAPGTLWLKKIDSRLKGLVAAEVAALARVLAPARLLACPAIPDLGRIVRNGAVIGTGVDRPLPVAAALPPDWPVDVPDADSDADLDRMVAQAAPGTLFVGARGLASALARRVAPGHVPVAPPSPDGPIGFVIGSRDPVTLAQVDQLRQPGGPVWIAAPDGAVPAGAACGAMVVQAVAGAGASGHEVSHRLARGVLDHFLTGLRSLVVTGGETAGALLAEAGIGLLQVLGEVQPGLPLCRALDRPGFPALVTKSGGFGPPSSLWQLWQAAPRKDAST